MLSINFSRPTLADLIARVRSDLLSRFAADDILRRSDAEIYARVEAAAIHSLYGFVEYLAYQILPDTAETEWLERHASLWGITRKQASKASGVVTMTAIIGSIMPAGTRFRSSAGQEYTSTSEVIATTTTLSVEIEALEGGDAGNLDSGEILSLITPVSGVQTSATVTSDGLAEGSDIENDADLRIRVRQRIQEPPHGGAAYDYKAWALEVAGVTRAWVYPLYLGAGTVGVSFVMDGREDIIPASQDIIDVQAYLDERRPVTAQVVVFAPIPSPLNLTIQAIPNTADVRVAIQAEVADFIQREAEPGGTLYISRLREVISTAYGEYRHVLVSPSSDVTSTTGHITTLGAISWS